MKTFFLISILSFSFISAVFAAPTYKNCGKPVQDNFCSDTACRTDFDPTSVVTNCEMDFSTPQQPGWTTQCENSIPDKVTFSVSADGNSINFQPKLPLTSLAGLHIYTSCTSFSYKGR